MQRNMQSGSFSDEDFAGSHARLRGIEPISVIGETPTSAQVSRGICSMTYPRADYILSASRAPAVVAYERYGSASGTTHDL